MKILKQLALMVIILPALSFAGDEHSAHKTEAHTEHKKESVVESLSPELRQLLAKEMQALQGGMMSIIPAYVAGNWNEIKETASKMKNSYIFKQELTKTQAKELHSVLPAEFIEKDKKFHYLAGMLSHVTEMEKPELVNFYFSEMAGSCIACHTEFATHKFPNLKAKNTDAHAH